MIRIEVRLRWPSLVVMLLVAWGILVSPGSLESQRPPTKDGTLISTPEEHKIHARLWQDPLATAADAATEESKEQQKDHTGPTHPRRQTLPPSSRSSAS